MEIVRPLIVIISAHRALRTQMSRLGARGPALHVVTAVVSREPASAQSARAVRKRRRAGRVPGRPVPVRFQIVREPLERARKPAQLATERSPGLAKGCPGFVTPK
jgi:hypothetical protein